jgi:hypothetical protein
MLSMRLCYASLCCSWAGESSSSKEGVIESIGIPDQYGVAIEVLFLVLHKTLSMRFVPKPDWYKWTATVEEVIHQEKCTLRNNSTIPV